MPNNGADPDMVATLEHEKLASIMVNHNWDFGTEESKAKWHNKAKDTDYNFAPALDGDMISTAKHLTNAEASLKHKWVIADVQLNEENMSDPICGSGIGCYKSKWTKDEEAKIVQYPHDPIENNIKITLANEKSASQRLQHVWNPDVWINWAFYNWGCNIDC